MQGTQEARRARSRGRKSDINPSQLRALTRMIVYAIAKNRGMGPGEERTDDETADVTHKEQRRVDKLRDEASTSTSAPAPSVHAAPAGSGLDSFLNLPEQSRPGGYINSKGEFKWLGRERWYTLMNLLSFIDLKELAQKATTSFINFWYLQGVVYICLDESMVPFTGEEVFVVFIERKPNPWGGVVYILATRSTVTGRPIPLILIPNFFKTTADSLSPAMVIDQACRAIMELQQRHVLPVPVVLTCDAAFGDPDLIRQFSSSILFVMNTRQRPEKAVITSNLALHEARMVLQDDILITAWVDGAIMCNYSSCFALTSPPPPLATRPFLSRQAVTALMAMPIADLQLLFTRGRPPISMPQEGDQEKRIELVTLLAGGVYKDDDSSGSGARTSAATTLTPVRGGRRSRKVTTEPSTGMRSVAGETEAQRQERRSRELDQLKLDALKRILREELHARISGNKPDLIKRIIKYEGPGFEALRKRMLAFLENKIKSTRAPMAVALYKLTFNFIDRIDLFLFFILFPWRIEDFAEIFFIYIIRLIIISTYVAHTEKETAKFDYTDLKAMYPTELLHITAFVKKLSQELWDEEKVEVSQAKLTTKTK